MVRSERQGCSGDGNHDIQVGGSHEVVVLMTAGRIVASIEVAVVDNVSSSA